MKPILTILGALVIAAGILYFAFGPKAAVKSNPTPATGQSGIMGEVRLGPTCPTVSRTAPNSGQCADKLYQGNFQLMDVSGSMVIKEFSSDAQGQFKVEIPAGEYLIRNKPNGSLYPNCGKSGVVPVEDKKFTEVIVFCDTGIR